MLFVFIVYQLEVKKSIFFWAGVSFFTGIACIIEGFIRMNYKNFRGSSMAVWANPLNDLVGRRYSKSETKKFMTSLSNIEGYIGTTMGIVFLIESKSPCVYLGLKAEVCLGLLDARSVPRTKVRGLSNTSTSLILLIIGILLNVISKNPCVSPRLQSRGLFLGFWMLKEQPHTKASRTMVLDGRQESQPTKILEMCEFLSSSLT